jgi:hypothetical protein
MQNPKKELRDYLNKLIFRLLYIKGINKQLKLLKKWEIPDKIIALETGAYFFKLVSYSFNRTLLIELCMLLCDREKKGIVDWLSKAKENSKSLEPIIYNPDSGKREILRSEAYQKIVRKQQELIASKKDIIDRVKGRRDKALAHSDARYFNEPDDLYIKFPLSIKEIGELINIASEILSMQHIYLFGSDLDIQVYTTSNIDTILWHIRGFKRVLDDKKAEFLYPYFYRFDNFEEKRRKYLRMLSRSHRDSLKN